MDQQQLKHCPICNNDLPVDEFGLCRARRDGRNLYCKCCIRKKVTIARRNLKEYKTTRKRVLQDRYWAQLNAAPIVDISTKRAKQSPVDRIRELIREQPRTQRELRTETKLPKDMIGEVLSVLLLDKHEIKSVWSGDERTYYYVEEKPVVVIQRKPSVLGGFSSVCALMPGKRAVG